MNWAGLPVLVTGHTGFMGGWAVRALAMRGADISGFALDPPTQPSLFESARLQPYLTDVRGDIRDADAVAKVVAERTPALVLHFAAQPLVRRAHREPVLTMATNAMGTVNLLEAIRRSPSVKAAIVVTSDKVYAPPAEPRAHRESDPLGGREPYGASKAAAELAVEAWRSAFVRPNVAVATLRAGNVIGGGDWAEDRLVPDAMRAFSAQRALTVRHPSAVRPWQHVLEPVAFALALSERLLTGEAEACGAWNIGPGPDDIRSVAWLADRLASAWGDGANWRTGNDPAPVPEARYLALDSSKAGAAMNWRPRLRLADAIARTVAWYRAYYRGEDVGVLTARQIAEFFGDA